MKKWQKALALVLALMMVVSVFAACQPQAADPSSSEPVSESTPADESSDEPSETSEEASEPAEEDPVEEEVVFGSDLGTLPREESLYYNGIQWGAPSSSSPFSGNPNNGLVCDANESARITVWETLYMFNQNDGKAYPLLADGDWQFNADQTELTFKIKEAAKWSDGTPVTAEDVKATFDTHVLVASNPGTNYGPYISEITADGKTGVVKANKDSFNPQKMKEFMCQVYIMQKAWLDSKLATYGEDYEGFKNDPWFEDFPHSGPYAPAFFSSQKSVIKRDDNYWGQDASMWGKLPAPKYIVHNVYKDNDAGRLAFTQGEVDVAQQFMDSVPDMWNVDGLPVTTFIDEPYCYQSASMPSIFFNCTKDPWSQLAVREAIAYAIDYDQINSSAMSGYSPTFEDSPRSIIIPTLEGEAKYVDQAALADLQWGSREYDKANKVLDDAGILDSDGDGYREYNGEKIVGTCMCPKGWSDWEASLEVVAAAGKEIGIDLSTQFVETSVWTESLQTGDFDIIMNSMNSTSISAPWGRSYSVFDVKDAKAERVFWGYHRLQNDEITAKVQAASTETDEAKLKEIYTDISKYLLEQKPVVALMYRPAKFHTINETVWTGFPEEGDGSNIPPQICIDGYGIAALYNITNS